ncbi:MAG: site-specific integrase [Deltaproteobacteria bacterium]|nr:site-specific integrase [Deltaproteobacteria bacterium]
MRRLKSGYQADFYYEDGDGVQRRFRALLQGKVKDRREALKIARQLQREAGKLGYVPGYQDPTVEKEGERDRPRKFESYAWYWYEIYAKARNRPSEQRNKESILCNYLIPYFGRMDLAEIGALDIEEFTSRTLNKGLSRKSVNNYLGVLRKMLNSAAEWEFIEKVPKVRALKVELDDPEFYTVDERDHFLAVCNAKRPEWYPYFVTAFHTGMRAGEMVALKWEDVDFYNRKIRVRRSEWRGHEGTPKGRRFRDVPMNSFLLDVLLGHRHPAEYVFYNPSGARLDCNAGTKVLKTVARYAGLRAIRRHDMRHTFASNIASATGNLVAVKNLLGHQDLTTTMRYAHLTPSQHREVVEAIVAPNLGLETVEGPFKMVNEMVNGPKSRGISSSGAKEMACKFKNLQAVD